MITAPTKEQQELVYEVLRGAHYHGTLEHVIGEALGKNAVLIALIAVGGPVTVCADSRATTEHAARDRSMIVQMVKLLHDNMDNMKKIASQQPRGPLEKPESFEKPKNWCDGCNGVLCRCEQRA